MPAKSYETDRWPVVPARWYRKISDRRFVRVLVIHDMEFPERKDTAEVIAHDFATRPESSKASAHVTIDANSVVQCVRDNDVAFAAPGCNSDGIQLELAGFAAQTQAQWMDEYGLALLRRAADVAAQYCLKYAIPPKRLTDSELAAGALGIVGHDQVSRVYKQSDHTDPGPNFPWDYFMGLVVASVECRK